MKNLEVSVRISRTEAGRFPLYQVRLDRSMVPYNFMTLGDALLFAQRHFQENAHPIELEEKREKGKNASPGLVSEYLQMAGNLGTTSAEIAKASGLSAKSVAQVLRHMVETNKARCDKSTGQKRYFNV